jgi:RimJ/RimL family protein N-acetyltransferase
MMNTQLFESERIRLGAMDAERDAEIESRWTHDVEYVRMLGADTVRPQSSNQIKKRYDEIAKNERFVHFAIRARDEDRLIGFVRFAHIEWTHGLAWLTFGIGEADARGKGLAREAMRLALRYAFGELNLYRIAANVPDYNERAKYFLERNGFVLELRRREAIYRDGKRWDSLTYGLLKSDWKDA